VVWKGVLLFEEWEYILRVRLENGGNASDESVKGANHIKKMMRRPFKKVGKKKAFIRGAPGHRTLVEKSEAWLLRWDHLRKASRNKQADRER